MNKILYTLFERIKVSSHLEKIIFWISSRSLWIYLWHILVLSLVAQYDSNLAVLHNPVVKFILVVIGSIIITILQDILQSYLKLRKNGEYYNMKIVTIVIPTYRRADRIERAVRSALSQTIDVEVIVVDDNGENSEISIKTRSVLETLINSREIKYISNKKNSGGSFSRNQGLAIATGNYITFLDDDDEIDSTKIEKQVKCLEFLGTEYGAVYTAYKKIMEDGSMYKSSEFVSGMVYEYALSRSLYVGSGSNLLVRTDIAKEINGYDVDFRRNQDLEFMTRILKNYKLAYVNEQLLTIHYEIREVKLSYLDRVTIDEFYLKKFKSEIDELPIYKQEMIYKIIALERFRYSLSGHLIDGVNELIKNRVGLVLILKYLIYMMDRYVNKLSYGFKGKIGRI